MGVPDNISMQQCIRPGCKKIATHRVRKWGGVIVVSSARRGAQYCLQHANDEKRKRLRYGGGKGS